MNLHQPLRLSLGMPKLRFKTLGLKTLVLKLKYPWLFKVSAIYTPNIYTRLFFFLKLSINFEYFNKNLIAAPTALI